MNENGKPLELLKLLELEEGAAAGERMRRWAEAFEGWMEERRKRFHRSVAADACRAWQEFLALTGKPPWEATVADVEAYVEALQKRKLRPATIKVRLAGLTKFYEYCQAHQIDGQCEAGFNPVRGVRRPKVKDYEKANYLSRKEEAALLKAIRQDPSPMGKRDYAMILMLLRTGWKAASVRNLKWREMEGGEEGIRDRGALPGEVRMLSWGSGSGERCLGAGEHGSGALPEEVWQAVMESLQATGRWESIQPEEYVFAPSRAPLVREARKGGEDWDGSRPLSGDEMHYLVKLHAGRAGLKAEKITCHTLRHTAAMRRVEAGASAEAVGAMLGMKWAGNVKVYTRRLAERPKGRLRARKPAEKEIRPCIPADPGEDGPAGSGQIPSRGPFRAWRGNHLALRHGLYARYLPEFEWLAEQGVQLPEIDWVILRHRVVMRRAMLVGNEVRTLEEAMRILRVMGIAACRLVKAMKLRRKMQEEEREREWEEYLRGRSE